MGLPASKPVYAWHRHGQACADDPTQTQPASLRHRCGFLAGIIALLLSHPASAVDFRVATFNVSLSRDGPGLLVRAIADGGDVGVETTARIIATVAPDILLLTDFDYDHKHVAAQLYAQQIKDMGGPAYPFIFATRPNSGWQSGVDLDGDGWTGNRGDAFGFGAFAGAGGMVLLSRFPIDQAGARDFTTMRWSNLPNASLPQVDGQPYPSKAAHQIMRLSYTGHWDVPIVVPDIGAIRIFASHVTPPVFDGPEDANGLRNCDEIRFWSEYLGGAELGGFAPRSEAPFVVLADFNADPNDGEGCTREVSALLDHPLIQDPEPASTGGAIASDSQGGPNIGQVSPPEQDTADWDETRTPGNLRVDYVLPASSFQVVGAGVFWPIPSNPMAGLMGSGDRSLTNHRLVWVDLRLDRQGDGN